jgi:hypothetical protein
MLRKPFRGHRPTATFNGPSHPGGNLLPAVRTRMAAGRGACHAICCSVVGVDKRPQPVGTERLTTCKTSNRMGCVRGPQPVAMRRRCQLPGSRPLLACTRNPRAAHTRRTHAQFYSSHGAAWRRQRFPCNGEFGRVFWLKQGRRTRHAADGQRFERFVGVLLAWQLHWPARESFWNLLATAGTHHP